MTPLQRPPAMEIDSLASQWRACRTEYGRAVLEDRIWKLWPAPRPKRRSALSGLLGAPQAHLSDREMILSHHAPGFLWKRVDGDMTRATAYMLLRLAEKERRPIDEVVASYDTWPVWRAEGDKVMRRRPPRKRGRRAPSLPAGESRARAIWTQVRGLVGEYLADKLPELQPHEADRLRDEIARDLEVLTSDWQERIRRRTREPTGFVARREVIDACRALHLDPPRPGKPVDMGRAKKLWRKLSREYHPDKRGDDATRAEFEAVTNAWRTLQDYERELSQHGGANGVAI